MTKFDWNNAKQVTSTAGKKTPTFSITRSAYARLNKRFKEKHDLREIKSVTMKYEEMGDKAIAGFRFFKEKNKGSFSVNEDDRTQSLWFSVRSLFNNLNIDRKKFKSQKFDPEIIRNPDGEGDIFIIEINKKGII